MRLSQYPVDQLPKGEEDQLVRRVRVILLTVTPVEHAAVLGLLSPLPKYRFIVQVFGFHQTYYIGVLGKHLVAYTQCGMGAEQRDAAMNVTNDVLHTFAPAAVIMMGIAFGLSREKGNKRLGDVLVSKTVFPYEVAKLHETENEYRGQDVPAGPCLVERFKQREGWSFERSKNTMANVHWGQILSGSKLVNRKRFAVKLAKDFPNAIGGDMEGIGVASPCERHKKEWIVVKGICDWGYNKQDRFQCLAARAAVHYTNYILSKRGILLELGVEDAVSDHDRVAFTAHRTSPLWTLNCFRSGILASFCADLKSCRRTGLSSEVFTSVNVELEAIEDAISSIPCSLFRGISMQVRMANFVGCFHQWANVRGNDSSAALGRDLCLDALRKARRRLSETVRKSSYLLGVGLDNERIGPLERRTQNFIKKHWDVFPNVAKQITAIRSGRPT